MESPTGRIDRKVSALTAAPGNHDRGNSSAIVKRVPKRKFPVVWTSPGALDVMNCTKKSVYAVRPSAVPQFVGIQVSTTNAGDVCVTVAVQPSDLGMGQNKFWRKRDNNKMPTCCRDTKT